MALLFSGHWLIHYLDLDLDKPGSGIADGAEGRLGANKVLPCWHWSCIGVVAAPRKGRQKGMQSARAEATSQGFLDFDDEEDDSPNRQGNAPIVQGDCLGAKQHLHEGQVDDGQLQ